MKYFTIAFFFLFSLHTASSQEQVYIDSLSRWMANVYMNTFTPEGPLQRNMPKTGIGIGGEVLYRIKHNQPLFAGLGFHTSAFERYKVKYPDQLEDGTPIDIEEKTVSRLFGLSMHARYHPEINSIFQPYIQGFAGFNHYFTNTKLIDDDENEEFDSFIEQGDWVFHYGIQGGINIIPNAYYIRGDIRVGYMRSLSVNYMILNEDWIDEAGFPIEFFEEKNSPTSFITLHAGMTFIF